MIITLGRGKPLSELPELKDITKFRVHVDGEDVEAVYIDDFNTKLVIDGCYEVEPGVLRVTSFSKKDKVLENISVKPVEKMPLRIHIKDDDLIVSELHKEESSTNLAVLDYTLCKDDIDVEKVELLPGLFFNKIKTTLSKDRIHVVNKLAFLYDKEFTKKIKKLNDRTNKINHISILQKELKDFDIAKLDKAIEDLISHAEGLEDPRSYSSLRLATMQNDKLMAENIAKTITNLEEEIAETNLEEYKDLKQARVEGGEVFYKDIKDCSISIISSDIVFIDNILYIARVGDIPFPSFRGPALDKLIAGLDKEKKIDMKAMTQLYESFREKFNKFLISAKERERQEQIAHLTRKLNDIRLLEIKKQLANVDSSIATTVSNIQQLENNMTSYHKTLVQYTETKTALVNQLAVKEQESVNERLSKDIIQNEHFDGLFQTKAGGNICFKLKDMYFEEAGKKFKLPENLYICIKESNNEVLILCDPKQLITGWDNKKLPHPHCISPIGETTIVPVGTEATKDIVVASFKSCWGNIYSSEIPKLVAEKNYPDLFIYIIMWLKSVNTQDPAGRKYKNWCEVTE